MGLNLNNVIARAQRMMLDENFQRDVERAAKAHSGSGMRGGNSGNDLADLDAAIFGVSSAPKGTDIYQKVPLQENTQYGQPQQNYGSQYNGVQIVQEVQERRDPRSTKLPTAIVESFEKVPYQGDAFDISGGALSGLMLEQPNQPQRQVQPQPQPVQSYGGINTDLLKYVVNEAVKEALKGHLNESVGVNGVKGFRIAPGNIIQFIDSKGNLYEGKLELKKKASSR